MADVPVDSASSLPTRESAYVGRRVATLPAPTPVETLDPGRIDQVLRGLEPVDHTTSFEHEPTERLPLLRVEGAPTPTPAGKRRAEKTRRRRGSLVKALPSGPVLIGLAALAVSIGGTITAQGPSSTSASDAILRPPSALGGTSRVGSVDTKRGHGVTRDSDRQAQAAAAGSSLTAAANELATQHDTALAANARRAEAFAKQLQSNMWITPIEVGVYHLTARFGQYGLWSSFHTGLDFAAPTGTPIHAIAGGTIISTEYDGAYGNKTIERLTDGTEIWYCHQNEFGTSPGDVVSQGEVIGYVGSTGNTTGPHVHIEVRPGGGDPVDPFPAFEQHSVTP